MQQVDTQVIVTNAPFAPLFSILQPLLLPAALAGVLFGFAAIAVEWGGKRAGPSSSLQRVPVLVCAAVAVVAMIALVTNEIRRAAVFHPGGLVVFAPLLLMCAPVIFWRSRWQRTTVGVATVAVSVLAFITGFSIGVFFVPLVIAMVLVCFSYLRRPSGG
jgi:hypothetical protein